VRSPEDFLLHFQGRGIKKTSYQRGVGGVKGKGLRLFSRTSGRLGQKKLGMGGVRVGKSLV